MEAEGGRLASCFMILPYSFDTGLLTDLELCWQPESPSSPVSIPQCWVTDMRQCLAFMWVPGILSQIFMLVLQSDSEPSPQPRLLEIGSFV